MDHNTSSTLLTYQGHSREFIPQSLYGVTKFDHFPEYCSFKWLGEQTPIKFAFTV